MRVNIYIRKENESKWEAIPDKSSWVNELLSKRVPQAKKPTRSIPDPVIVPREDGTTSVYAHTPEQAEKAVKDLTKGFDFCKHGSVKGLCKKGCK